MTLRHRQSGSYGAPTTTKITNTNGDVQWTTTNPGNGKVSWMTDVVVPGFHRKSKDGMILMNPMTQCVESFETSGVGYAIRHTPSGDTEQGNGNMMGYLTNIGHGGVPFVISQSDVDSILAELCTRVRGSRGSGDANSWENLAELKKTLELIRHPVASFWKFDRRFPKSSIAKSATNAWLVYRYGISPIVRDVASIVKNLQNLRPPRKTTRAAQSISSESVTSSNIVTGIITTPITTRITETYSARVMSIDEANQNLSFDLGFTAKDLIRLPYDLTTLSFVADWFVNVGDYITALADYAVGPKNLGACMVGTRDVKLSATCSGSFLNSMSSTYELTRPFSGHVEKATRITQRVPGLLDPSLVVNTDFGLDRSVRIGDSLALIGQRIKTTFLHR